MKKVLTHLLCVFWMVAGSGFLMADQLTQNYGDTLVSAKVLKTQSRMGNAVKLRTKTIGKWASGLICSQARKFESSRYICLMLASSPFGR
ncbi:hypothetical protein, partial [Acanthopleuribacter pedis]